MRSKAQVIGGVLREPRYALAAALGAAGTGILYYVLTMQLLPLHAAAMLEADPIRLVASVGLTCAVSVLAGINIAVIIRRMRTSRRAGGSAVFGGALAAFTPGCPACTAPLAVLLGAAGGITLLPLGGLELKLVSAAALAGSLYWSARSMQRAGCCQIT
ncbi:MAG: hypothetical protein MPI95_05545 [Nitrosopumilus sp.]|nr:hypothetical protein [Nitrosopumilus sp.]CAI9832264.1 conserved membrane hypothetical protein [Nitrosopumilaceae archaeon]MDA7941815.1 hypothetical protein [Nitrosopumilus sp.]MDA7943044.1 hypothetical protein [Nitrosopumilus sp.]MDA7945456.1 hypothetical protein [Nitrosopumilus sp.]